MHLQHRIKLASIISKYHDTEYQWGQADCNLFFIDVHDQMYGTNDLQEIQGKYEDLKSGIRYLKKKIKKTPEEWMMSRHYTLLKHTDVKVGDVALFQHKSYESVFIYSDGAWWSMVEEQNGLVGAPTEDVLAQATSLWRKINE